MTPLIEITPTLYQASRRLSASVYLRTGIEVTVVDGGLRGSHAQTLRYLELLGRRPEEIGHLVATHCHTDHVGGFARLRALSRARVAVHEEEAPFLEGRLPAPNPFQHPLLAWLTEPLLRHSIPNAAVDLYLRDGDLLEGMQVIHTPGHTPGSISLFLPEEGVLIVGDALEYRFSRLGLPSRMFTADMARARSSIRRLATLDFDTLCFSHFPPIRRHARRTLQEFAGALE